MLQSVLAVAVSATVGRIMPAAGTVAIMTSAQATALRRVLVSAATVVSAAVGASVATARRLAGTVAVTAAAASTVLLYRLVFSAVAMALAASASVRRTASLSSRATVALMSSLVARVTKPIGGALSFVASLVLGLAGGTDRRASIPPPAGTT
jgi:hypothetical protein